MLPPNLASPGPWHPSDQACSQLASCPFLAHIHRQRHFRGEDPHERRCPRARISQRNHHGRHRRAGRTSVWLRHRCDRRGPCFQITPTPVSAALNPVWSSARCRWGPCSAPGSPAPARQVRPPHPDPHPGIIFIIGAIVAAISPGTGSGRFRVVIGVAIGAASAVAPVYISEIARLTSGAGSSRSSSWR